MKKSALVLFSGGSDSTWLAYKLAQSYQQVHLLTLNRKTFFRADIYSREKAAQLIKYFGPNRISHQVVPIDELHRKICFESYGVLFRKFGTLMASLTFSKLAMHWAALKIAKEQGIQDIFDGGTNYMEMYPDQNKNIGFCNYEKLYHHFGKSYSQPLYENNLNVEESLYLVGLNTTRKIRGSSEDKQVFYLEQTLLAHFLNYYLGRYGWEQYEEQMGKLYGEKIDFIKRQIS